jgi:cytochrome c oxidase cbb3-type subunit 3
MSTGMNLFVIFLIVVNIAGCAWLLVANRRVKVDPNKEKQSLGHAFDGIEELNNPLPAWWTWLFVLTIAFGVVYFVLYPGFGTATGVLGWSSRGQYDEEVEEADMQWGPIFDRYNAMSIEELQSQPQAIRMGARIFANNCSPCHGSDARGGTGYPNLTDDDWLYGGQPVDIVTTITNGRNGLMPPFGAAVGGEPGIAAVTEYVLSLSGRDHDEALALEGQKQFAMICSACHGQDGKGMAAIGAPNLTDDVWLHGGRREDIQARVREGIVNQMPAWGPILGPERVHLAAAYVFSLSLEDAEVDTLGDGS